MPVRVTFSSGFGNQLFQYAAAFALAQKHGVPIEADLSAYIQALGVESRAQERGFELGRLGLVSSTLPYPFPGLDCLRGVPRLRRWINAGGRAGYECPGRYTEQFDQLPARAYLQGYFQDKRYFQDDLPALCAKIEGAMARADPRPTAPPDDETLAVHYRLGDYLAHPEFYPDWIRVHLIDAIQNVCKGYHLKRACIFSDQPSASRQILDTSLADEINLIYPEGSMLEDFKRMARARYLLITNSTFSYWAGVLAGNRGGKVFAPARWSEWCPDPEKALYLEEWEVWG